MFILNCKNYPEASSDRLKKISDISKRLSTKYKIPILIAPPPHMTSEIAKHYKCIISQNVDNAKIGSSTGFTVPELLKKAKIIGSLINHSEHRISQGEVTTLVNTLRRLDMLSIVCVQDVLEAKKIIKLNPDYIAIEPPELIGTRRSVSTHRPELIVEASKIINGKKNKTKLLCGAGIISGKDVTRAIELGAVGILVASGIIKTKNYAKVMESFAKSFKG